MKYARGLDCTRQNLENLLTTTKSAINKNIRTLNKNNLTTHLFDCRGSQIKSREHVTTSKKRFSTDTR